MADMNSMADIQLKRIAFSITAGNRSSAVSITSSEKADGTPPDANLCVNHMLNLFKVILPHHPIRIRHLPFTDQTFVLYGHAGYQEMTLGQRPQPQIYTTGTLSWQIQMCDCVQTSNHFLYAVTRTHGKAVISCYDNAMSLQKCAEVSYPLSCLSSLAVDHNCQYLYGANQELNCVLRFTLNDLSLSKAEKFSRALWRPFDCCTSQVFSRKDKTASVQFLFVSNLDAGIFVLDLSTMEIVAECAEDLSPGAKYLAYDPKKCLLFVSSSSECIVCCYSFVVPNAPARPWLEKIGDFLVSSRRSHIRSAGPQCIMWNPSAEHLVVNSWSRTRGQFMAKVFRVNING